MQVISKARNDVVRATIETPEMFSKNTKLNLSHVISISLNVDFLEEHTSIEKSLSYLIHQTSSSRLWKADAKKLTIFTPSKDEEGN